MSRFALSSVLLIAIGLQVALTIPLPQSAETSEGEIKKDNTNPTDTQNNPPLIHESAENKNDPPKSQSTPQNAAQPVMDLKESHDSSSTEERRPPSLEGTEGKLSKTLEGVQNVLKNGADNIRSGPGVLLGGLSTAQKGIAEGIQNIRNLTEKQFETARNFGKETAQNIKNAVIGPAFAAVGAADDAEKQIDDIGKRLQDGAQKNLGENLQEGAQNVSEKVQDGAKKLGENVRKASDNARSFGERQLETVKNGVQKAAENVSGFVSGGLKTVRDVAEESRKLFGGIGAAQKGFGELPKLSPLN